jgi:two-component system, LytTR family, response regulator
MSTHLGISAMIADDEPPARRKLARLLAAHCDVSVIGEASTGVETVALLRKNRPDVLFLDVQMPGLDGFQVLEVLGELDGVAVVFVTAFDEYAVRAFEVQAMDYLLKPATEERLLKVLDRVRANLGRRSSQPATVEPKQRSYWKRILVRGPRITQFVDVQAIDWIEADRNYVVVHCGSVEHLVRTTIESFVAGLDPADFARINRSAAVNLSRVRELRPWTHGEYRIVLHSGQEISWSRRYVSSTLDRFLP